ncbi:MAG: hypothetical protein QW791_06535 [Candidatus Bathyarchaeia archaeon]
MHSNKLGNSVLQTSGTVRLAIIALALDVMTVMLLLTRNSRQHCRIVNPTKTSQQVQA